LLIENSLNAKLLRNTFLILDECLLYIKIVNIVINKLQATNLEGKKAFFYFVWSLVVVCVWFLDAAPSILQKKKKKKNRGIREAIKRSEASMQPHLEWHIDPENGSNMILQNVRLSLNCSSSHPLRLYSSLRTTNQHFCRLSDLHKTAEHFCSTVHHNM
jgi:hypothetical protein